MVDKENGSAYSSDARLSELFAAYREACPDPEPSARFMPSLWESIDARRSFALRLRRFAQGLITAAAAVCLLMSLYLVRPQPSPNTYLEVLAASQSHDALADEEIVRAVHGRN
jgi:hypothetical protein